jgi:hypothetical protein
VLLREAPIDGKPILSTSVPCVYVAWLSCSHLKRAVEALAGQNLHKQNFRRLIDQQGLVEETGAISSETGGRPAKLFRFRQSVLLERAVGGSKLPLSRPT